MQHRFGVEQRAALLERAGADQGYHPDLLLMTATPIPRTLALTVFGDLAVSGITGRPPGRGMVATRVVRQRSLDDLLAPLAAVLAAGGQAYVICPLREESEKVDAADAQSIHAAVRDRIGAQVGLLHGSLTEDAKLEVVAAFARGDLRALVSTTVVEVGIDVAAATLMAVLDADRFGLATLHQLRGRVGRGAAAAQCLLFHRAADAGRRLEILATSDDGLAIAEADLAERGPGHLLGTDQHGALRLRIADLGRDLDLLQDAHQHARQSLGSGLPSSGLERFLRWFSDGQALTGG
ncbi:MAG: hypothetical protein H0W72_12110 [Planctomycetes bacterium]|nr:hypothetical protein [Planctomycetota bacterium]